MVVELKNAQVMIVDLQTITLKDQSQHSLLIASCAVNERDGVSLYGIEAIGNDTIERMGLERGKTYNIKCALKGRVWGGRYQYTLQAYAAEAVVNESKQAQTTQEIF